MSEFAAACHGARPTRSPGLGAVKGTAPAGTKGRWGNASFNSTSSSPETGLMTPPGLKLSAGASSAQREREGAWLLRAHSPTRGEFCRRGKRGPGSLQDLSRKPAGLGSGEQYLLSPL